MRAPRDSNGVARAANSSASQPAPTPSTTRPPASRSRLATCLARTTGWRCGSTSTAVPSSTRSVTAAAIDRATIESNHGSSVAHVADAVGGVGVVRRHRRRHDDVIAHPQRSEPDSPPAAAPCRRSRPSWAARRSWAAWPRRASAAPTPAAAPARPSPDRRRWRRARSDRRATASAAARTARCRRARWRRGRGAARSRHRRPRLRRRRGSSTAACPSGTRGRGRGCRRRSTTPRTPSGGPSAPGARRSRRRRRASSPP